VAETGGVMTGQIRLLVVDDDQNQCRTLKKILDLNGYQTFTASRSQDAFSLLKETAFDLVFMDLVLKGDMNGIDIFREMKQIRPDVKAILYTGFGPEEEMRLLIQAVNEGMEEEFLRKPIEPEELIEAVKKHTGRQIYGR
jgi:DNA-binding NtrC family response regulator